MIILQAKQSHHLSVFVVILVFSHAASADVFTRCHRVLGIDRFMCVRVWIYQTLLLCLSEKFTILTQKFLLGIREDPKEE